MKPDNHMTQCLSIQPFWPTPRSNSVLIPSEKNGYPIAVVFENYGAKPVDSVRCIPGIGMIGFTFSLDPERPGALCTGTITEPKLISMPHKNLSHTFTCQFFPGEFTRIFEIPSIDLTNREFPLKDILSVGSLAEELASAPDFQTRSHRFEQFIRNKERRSKEHSGADLAQVLVNYVLCNHCDIRVAELEKKSGYSARYLQKLMTNQIGLTTKSVLIHARFQHALRTMSERPDLQLTEIALQNGYYDQGHFTNIFRSATGMSPSAFLREVQSKPTL